jgi:hypothetical protein
MSILKKYHNCVYYLTHDNGRHPFCVYIDEKQNNVYVYKSKGNNNNDLESYSELIDTYKPLTIFIGKSPLTLMTEFSSGHGPKFEGNSILLKIDINEYVFIGSCIYSFTTEHEIVSFFSSVGNNDVSYPYAIDSEDNFYFLLEYDNCINNAILKMNDISKHIDPYNYLYFIEKNISKQENIEWLYMGNEQYFMTTSSYPEEKYNDLIARLGDEGHMYIQYKNHPKKPISKNEYISLLKSYNEKVGLKPISNVKLIHKRIW